MSDKIQVDFETGNLILRGAYRANFPEKVGERAFSANVRASISKKIRQVYKAFRDVSDILKEKRLLHFGPKSGYKEFDRSDDVRDSELQVTEERVKTRYELINKLATVEVELTGQAKDGLYWLLFLWLHPSSPLVLPVGMQSELAWPVAEQIRALKALEKETGVDSKETIEVQYDDAEAEAEKGKVTEFPTK